MWKSLDEVTERQNLYRNTHEQNLMGVLTPVQEPPVVGTVRRHLLVQRLKPDQNENRHE